MLINLSCKHCEYKQSCEMPEVRKQCCIDCKHVKRVGAEYRYIEGKKIDAYKCLLFGFSVDRCDNCCEFERRRGQ